MIFKILNNTGSVITLGGVSYTNQSWVDIVPYWAFDNFKSTQNDIDGPNAGRNTTNGTMIRDKVSEKEKVNFVSVPLGNSDAMAIKNLSRPESFQVSTDMFSGSIQTYVMYANNRVLEYIRHYADGTDLIRLSFPITEV